jgi:UDP-N-acetylglucosamine 2-epimerase (non-hydrolysing)
MSVVGARPNFMKLASIARAIDDHNASNKNPIIDHLIVHTGQHYDDRMSLLFFEELKLPKPHINLNVGSASHALQTAEIMKHFEPVLLEHQPDVIVLVGDVNSTVACALVASKIQYNTLQHGSTVQRQHFKGLRPLIIHVEAGLRSFDRNMPEEINRILTDALSDLLFITEEDAMVNLQQEGIPREKIHFVGNVMIDTLLINLVKAQDIKTFQLQKNFYDRIKNGYGLVTLHRPSNVDIPETLKSLIECLRKISSKIPVIFPIHPRTKGNIESFGIYEELSKSNGILITEPLGYLEFLGLLRSARLVLTDSGGIQEETTFLRIPCITLRENTERPITVSLGTNYLVGINPEKILETAFAILDGKGKKGEIPRFWDGKAGQRIVEILVNKIVTSYQ